MILSVVVTYYNQPRMLQVQRNAWATYPKDVEIILVDDGSRIAAERAGRERVLRIHDDIQWNQDGARNLGASQAKGGALLMLDIDHVASREVIDEILASPPRSGVGYTFPRTCGGKPLRSAPNIYCVTWRDFKETGGYNEAYRGSYGTDQDFLPRLRRKVDLRPANTPLAVYLNSDVPDAATQGLDRTVRREFNSAERWFLKFDWSEL